MKYAPLAYLAAFMIGTALLATPGRGDASALSVGKAEVTKGSVYVVRDGQRQPLGLNEPVFLQDSLVTTGSGRAKILFDDGSTVFVGADSHVNIGHYSVKYGYRISAHFDVVRGKFRFLVKSVEDLDANFSVKTKSAKIEVTGTDFTVFEPMGRSPTETFLRSGKVVVRTIKERAFMMEPGQIARFISNGEVIVRRASSRAMGCSVMT